MRLNVYIPNKLVTTCCIIILVLVVIKIISFLKHFTHCCDDLQLSSRKILLRFTKEKNNSQRANWMKRMEEKYLKTNEMVEKVCMEFNNQGRTEIQRDSLMVDFDHKIASCLNAKVGSTTWSNYFYMMLPNYTRKGLEKKFGNTLFKQEIIRPYYKLPSNIIASLADNLIRLRQLKNIFKRKRVLLFSFVRHPFERLVSAYNDRVIQKNILFEHGYTTWYNNNHSFPSFVNLVLSEYKKSECSIFYDSDCLGINIHWKPFTSECSYCNIKYDVIGRMETFNEDVKYIFKKSGLSSILSLNLFNKFINSSKLKTKVMTKKYFSQLTENQINELYDMYRMDFEMFGYDPKPYFPID